MSQHPVLQVAAKAVIINSKGELLLVREGRDYDEGSQFHKYGIPGGRLEAGESYKDGLHREVMEETGLEVEILDPIYVGEWRPVIKGISTQIIAIFTVCKAKTTEVKLSEEHDDYKWVHPSSPGDTVFMVPDDMVVARLAKWLKDNRL